MAQNIPLLFTFREIVEVDHEVIEVTVRGRAFAFLDPDDGQWWFYGVNPGALAGSGSTPASAHASFRTAFRDVLLEFSKAPSRAVFETDARAFFNQVAEQTDREWWAAVEDVRSGRLGSDLEKQDANAPRGIDLKTVPANHGRIGGRSSATVSEPGFQEPLREAA